MECPFELPVKKQSYTGVLENVWYKIVANGITVISGLTEPQADYIVCVINSHEKLYRKGYEDGLSAYAWWKDGIQYVGTCGTTLKQALKEAEK